jgi:hypothetical protein
MGTGTKMPEEMSWQQFARKRAVAALMPIGSMEEGPHLPPGVDTIVTEYLIRYVVPQKIILSQIKSHKSSLLHPGFAIQTAHTFKNPIIEAWTDNEKIWEASFSKIIANTRIPIPIHKFGWNRVNPQKKVTLKLKASVS